MGEKDAGLRGGAVGDFLKALNDLPVETYNKVVPDAIDGKLPIYAWPGGYPLVYIGCENDDWNQGLFCPECANQVDAHPPIVDSFVHWEGSPIYCDGCGKEIESAYGDPDE